MGKGVQRTASEDVRARLRHLPGVDVLLSLAETENLVAVHGRSRVADALRAVLERYRRHLLETGRTHTDNLGHLGGGRILPADVVAEAARDLERQRPRPPRRVINATGVIVHTNLGRAPLGPTAIDAMVDAAGYCDLEYDLDSGSRGSRGASVDRLLAEVCQAPAAMAVNNAASALILVLATQAAGRGVLVSRGELIEIGGSFRLPDILQVSGARLVEVGTTNRTRQSDYRLDPPAAASATTIPADDVALILRMHPSNYRIVGFTEAPTVTELADVARERGVPLVYDVGSGLPSARPEPWAQDEPSLAGALAEGADLVIASGDKLLGGPQAGLVAGREDLVAACRRHPLARALRLDKLRVAALAATLEAHATSRAETELPVWQMLSADPQELEQRSARLAATLPHARVAQGLSVPGGGSAPGTGISGPVVRIAARHAETVAQRLRAAEPPVVVRVDEDVVIDLRTVDPRDDNLVTQALSALTASDAPPRPTG